jgi:peptide alpha-N-acetyltransferase
VRFRLARELLLPRVFDNEGDANRKREVDKAGKPENAKVDEVLKANLSIVPATKDLKSFNEAYLSKHKDNARRTQAGLKARQLIDSSTKAQNEQKLVASVEKADLKETVEGLGVLKEWKSEGSVREEYVKAARARWPEATVFKSS